MAEKTVPVRSETRPPTAVVLKLPSAALPAIEQQGRPGRNPKCVTALWRERMERQPRLKAVALLVARNQALAARDECWERCEVSRKALKQAEEADIRVGNEYDGLAQLVKRLNAEIAALSRQAEPMGAAQ